MSMSRTLLATLAVAALAGCGRGERRESVAADSLNRDLQLAPTDTSRPLSDRPTETARREPARATEPTRPKPTTTTRKPTPTPATEPSAAPRPGATGASLAAGTVFHARLVDSISSARNKVGDELKARVLSDVKDEQGRVVVPAGSVVTLEVTAIHESENKSDTGTLTLAPSQITVNGKSYALNASIDSIGTQLQGRKTNAGDIGKVGAGAAIGAVVGRVLGGSTKGAVIGGVLGGAVGAQRAVETKDRDVVVPAGSSVKLTLKDRLGPIA
jgi:hypothetical protein